jgi:tRNA uridine 5-carboxymethylaminomethyl modification enzyme
MMSSASSFDIVVVGGGHAGIEACLAAARMGARTALVTHDANEIGRMPCNPAIGGLGKGHLVREIDVLGGDMGIATDESGIQFRLLNRKKGPAVQSPRAQADKHHYQRNMMERVLQQDRLEVIQGDAAGLLVDRPKPHQDVAAQWVIRGVALADGREVAAPRVVLCTGTFLKGLMHVGDDRKIGGREGAASSDGLSGGLRELGFTLRRLKTGTPPRLWRDSIDFTNLAAQPGDPDPQPFSCRTIRFSPDQVDCHMAYTNAATHELIRQSLGRSPLFGGVIEGQGPRYCPSIEDKVVRFADKDRHLLFLEPEGRDDPEVYVNGLSTSLPADVQEKVVRSVAGLEGARLARYGYAIEYDSVPSWQIHRSLESKLVAGLYLAGQLLGTSGYEEAAGQGLVAGANAVRSLSGGAPLGLGRDQAYLGVMVDDLVTKDITEPYRMFTSRAEHRLSLRCDNAEARLTPLALELGLISGAQRNALLARREMLARLGDLMAGTSVFFKKRGRRLMASECLRFPGVTLQTMRHEIQVEATFWDAVDLEVKKLQDQTDSAHLVSSALYQLENDFRYDGYIAKHNRLLKNQEHLDHLEMPAGLDYHTITALSYEAREKLNRVRPDTLGQAGRIDGVRAGDLAVLMVYLKKLKPVQESGENGSGGAGSGGSNPEAAP